MKKPITALLLSSLAAAMWAMAQETPVESPVPPPAPSTNVAPAAPSLAPAETPADPAPPPTQQPTTPAAAPAAADTNSPAAPAIVPVAAGAAPATPAAQGESGSTTNEVVPLIVIDEVPLTDAIRNLARQSELNFQFDPTVTTTNQPNVTIRFENVTAQEALEAVLENHNLQLVKEPRSRIARITFKVPKAEEPLYSQIFQLRYGDPSNMVSLVKSTLSPRSVVLHDSRTSQLLITTTLREMETAEALIRKLDTQTKQVLIEARLLETGHAPTSIKGIDWTGTLEGQKISLGNNSLPGTPGTPAQTIVNGNNTVVVPAAPPTQGGVLSDPKIIADTSRGGFGFNPATAFLNADGVSAVLSFLNKDADTEVVATPRAVTMDNQPAMLSVTRAFPIFQITPGSANSPAGAQIQYTNLGVILNVTPRIAADSNISLRVVPEVSNIDGKDQQTINGTLNVANIYAIRKIETQVLIPSGNTLVMGGLINDTRSRANTKVPILGDIPGIGMAFRKEEKRRNKVNLIIFITPTIVDESAFQSTKAGTEFLKTRMTEKPEEKESAWDSAKPKDWSKPKKTASIQ